MLFYSVRSEILAEKLLMVKALLYDPKKGSVFEKFNLLQWDFVENFDLIKEQPFLWAKGNLLSLRMSVVRKTLKIKKLLLNLN